MRHAHLRGGLFGGALFAAGISAANAQVLVHGPSSALIQVDSGGGPDVLFQPESSLPIGFGITAYISGDFAVSARADSGEVSLTHARANSNTFSYTVVAVDTDLYALEDTRVLAEWDFGGWDGYLRVFDSSAGAFIVDEINSRAGSVLLDLAASGKYVVAMATYGAEAGGDSAVAVRAVGACPGDVDGNGVINADDIDAFVDAFLFGCP